MLDEVKQFVNKSFKNSIYGSGSVKHFERTIDWLKELKSDVDEPMLIAAYAHDIERAFRDADSQEDFFKDKEFNDKDFLAAHQIKGAEIISDFLKKQNYPEDKIKRIYNMIRRHEEEGDEESDLIKDADSISYLENNAAKHTKWTSNLGIDKVKRKIDWMYSRISSDKAKALAGPYYEKVLKIFESYASPKKKTW